MINESAEIRHYRDMVIDSLLKVDMQNIVHVVQILLQARKDKKTVFVFGNGGSGATASHFVGDLTKSLSYLYEKKFKAICLNDNIPGLMAYANDISYEEIFVEPLKNFVERGDVVIGISGSGNSKNVIKALEYANLVGATTIAFCGFNGGYIKQLAGLSVHVPINDMEIVEDIHMSFFHSIKRVLMLIIQQEKTLFKGACETSCEL